MSAHEVIRRMMEQAGDKKDMPTAWVFKNLVEITVDLAQLNAAAGQMELALRQIADPGDVLTLELARTKAADALVVPDLDQIDRDLIRGRTMDESVEPEECNDDHIFDTNNQCLTCENPAQ
jgi:hypothetical protein